MAKLTDTQLIVLSKAAARDDGLATVPNKMNKPAASKVGASLVARKLMREVRAKPGMPIWREDEDDRPISLVITRAGREAIGVDEDGAGSEGKRRAGTVAAATGAGTRPSGLPRAGSKQALVVEMLSAKGGTTLDSLSEATGWLPHTTRAALTGLRKRGYAIVREGREGKTSIYRVAKADLAKAA
jgi:hypothetical protein